MKLNDFFSILKSTAEREFSRRKINNELLNKSLKNLKTDLRYFSVVEIIGDSIIGSIVTFEELEHCYHFIKTLSYEDSFPKTTLGIVYHQGKERLTHKKLASCSLVCLYGFISVETLKSIENKHYNFY